MNVLSSQERSSNGRNKFLHHLLSHSYRQGLSFQATKYSSRLSLFLGRLYSVVQSSPKLFLICFPSKISNKVQPPSCVFWELNSRHSKHLEPATQEVPLRLVNFYYYGTKWLLTSFSSEEESSSQPHSLSPRSKSSPLYCAHTLRSTGLPSQSIPSQVLCRQKGWRFHPSLVKGLLWRFLSFI